jgi:hypothetical protein
MVAKYQRTSSAVEGRNGYLSRLHHARRGFSKQSLQVLTIIHNFDLGVVCTTPQKGTFQNEMRESHEKKSFALFLSSSDDCMFKELHTRYSSVS